MDHVSLTFWHGGLFRKQDNELVYLNGNSRTFEVDPDELCWFWLEELAKKCGTYNIIDEIFYLIPGLTFDKGLRRVYNDKEVLEMTEILMRFKSLDCYVLHGIDKEDLVLLLPSPLATEISTQPTIDGAPAFDGGEGERDCDSSRVGAENVVQNDDDDDEQGSIADLEDDEEDEPSNYFFEGDDEYLTGDDISDDEYRTAKERVKDCNSMLFELAQQLQKEAAEGKLGFQTEPPNCSAETNIPNVEEGCFSDYEGSEEEINTPPDTCDEDLTENRKKRTCDLVPTNTDFSVFEWKVGQRFATREDFKKAVTKYAILQGRNLTFVASNKKRQQRLGVRCVQDCPFRLYSSWDSRRATFSVKTVQKKHKCHRNMKKNKQLKSTWVSQQFLDVFKARPHWPAKEIIETVKRAYKVVIKRDFAYKVKYNAHKLLHGSMKDHYKKVGRYLEALKISSPRTELQLVTLPNNNNLTPIFQRLFICFEGLQNGWKEGCRKVICVDACFLKTFLGGQLMCAVGRDGNEQMYPIAWAVVEGENNLSWEWFFINLQKCLALGDGDDIAIISDEHQVHISIMIYQV
ncbi:unnamed protein product [Cuscuta epithymum]|uniref:Transposase MuDR plant domain-containing protein n=1 Tax=Cuscuta epithymum TaxID=186058 RepID=A0AAV0ERN2_9ASTE|nr:unnamed protein product [Cuscuta epithymum]